MARTFCQGGTAFIPAFTSTMLGESGTRFVIYSTRVQVRHELVTAAVFQWPDHPEKASHSSTALAELGTALSSPSLRFRDHLALGQSLAWRRASGVRVAS